MPSKEILLFPTLSLTFWQNVNLGNSNDPYTKPEFKDGG
jgi:hypothetical protein